MKFMIPALTAVVFLGCTAAAMADSCASAKREMIYGRMALQEANNKQGYLESAKQFEAAVNKAPSCAQAHFNLGVVYEKAKEYQKSLNALQKYLSLAPHAADAEQVQDKIIELEYRINRAVKAEQKAANQIQVQEDEKKRQRERAYQIGGMWKNEDQNQKFQIIMNGNSFDIYMVGSCRFGDCSRGWVKANQHDYTGTIGKNGEITGFSFVTALFAEGLSQNKKEGVPCKVAAGWYPIKAALSQQGRKMTIKSKIPYRDPFCGSISPELILIR